MIWLMITLVGGDVNFVGPFGRYSDCERERARIVYVDREVRDAHCVVRRER